MRRASMVAGLLGMSTSAVAVACGLAAPAYAAPVYGTPIYAAPADTGPAYPRPVGRCVDSTGVLGAPLCARISTVLRRDETHSSDEIAVAVLPSTGAASIESWGTGLFNAWGVGKQDKNNGVLLVVAVDDHRMRLVTGRGLSTRLSDAAAAAIVTNVITPQFAKGAYANGILAGLDAVRHRLKHPVAAKDRLSTLAAGAPKVTAPVHPVVADTGTDGTDSGYADAATAPADDDGMSGAVLVVVFLAIGGLIVSVWRSAAGSGSTSPAGRDNRSVTQWGASRTGFGHAPPPDASLGAWSASSTSSSSDGGGFGGGGSDGGGASGSW